MNVLMSPYVIPGLYSAKAAKNEVITCIKLTVCEHFNVPYDALAGRGRINEWITARHYAVYLSFFSTKMSLKKVGHHFDGRDHSTVINSIRQIHDWLKYYQEHRNHINALWEELAKDNIEKQHRIIKLS
jgi:chromosomal replication initiator protein